MTEQAEAWAPIVKTTKNPDGTLYVYGKVSDDTLDRDEQKCDSAWLGRAVPEWFAESGNIREQHSRIAAGKAVEHEVKADGGHYLRALIVDPVSVMKVETDVLKGFSIGIKRPRITLDKSAPGGRIVDGKIVEVSLVDRPCNPGCLVAIVKADGDGGAELVDQQLVEHPVPRLIFTEAPVVKDDSTSVLTATALRALATLIASEAGDLANGQWSETYDISRLLSAVRSLRDFAESEAYETSTTTPEVAAPPAPISLEGSVSEAAAQAVSDALKTVPLPGGTATTLAPKADESEAVADKVDAGAPAGEPGPEFLTKADAADLVTKSDLTSAVTEAVKTALPDALPEAITDAVTKAMEPVTAALKATEDRLAKVEALPTGGGPVLARTASQTAAADGHDKTLVKAELEDLERKADEAQTNGSTTLARGYRDKAAALAARL